MDKERETGFVLIFGVALMLFIALVALCSCTTKQKVITEYVHVHDTIRTYHTDTIHKTNIVKETVHDTTTVEVHDTLFHDREQIIILNENGDTIKEKSKESSWQKTKEQVQYNHSESRIDSTDYYRARSDSLEKALREEKQKEKVITKTRYIFPWYNYLVIALIIAALAYLLKKLNHK